MRVSLIYLGLLAYSLLAGAAEKPTNHAVGAAGTADVFVPNRHTPPPPLDLGIVGKLDWHEETDRLVVTTPKGYA